MGLVRHGFFAVDTGKGLPESFFIEAAAVVFHHGQSALPYGAHQLLGIVALFCHLFAEELEVAFGKDVLIHGEQRAVEIKQNHF